MKLLVYKSLVILVLLGICRVVLYAQEIPVFNITQNECTTQCSSGLLNLLDTCRFHIEIAFDKEINAPSTLLFEIMKSSNDVFLPLFNLQLHTDCTGPKENAEYYCTQRSPHNFTIVIKPKDMSRFNDAQMRAYLTTVDEIKVYSSVQRFPHFYDQTNATGILKINGQNASSFSNCNKIIDVTDVTIEFQCLSPATPCLIELKVNEIIVNQSKDYAVFSHKYTKGEELNVSVWYAACSLAEKHNTMHCKIKTGVKFLQDITTFQLSKHKCDTKCQNEIYINSCMFYFNINFYAAVLNTSFLFFELLGPSDDVYKPLFNMELLSECVGHKEHAEFSCTRIDSRSFDISISPSELDRFREAKIRAYLKLNHGEVIHSESLRFPRFYDQSQVMGKFKINGHDMSTTSNNCSVTTIDNTVALEFNCISSAKPCLIDIRVNDVTVVKHQKNDAAYNGFYGNGMRLSINIKYGDCSVIGGYRNFSCAVKIAPSLSNMLTSEQPQWLIPVVASTVTIVGVTIGIMLFCFKRYRICSEDASPSRQDNEIMTQSVLMLADNTHDDTAA